MNEEAKLIFLYACALGILVALSGCVVICG